jgi:hypothetical protein
VHAETIQTRVALVCALLAMAVSGAALDAAMNRPASPWPVTCGMAFHDAQTGGTAQMYVPCSPVPVRP